MRRPLFVAIFAVLVSGIFAIDADAQTYPNRPITIIAANPPGGLTDTAARIVADGLQSALGQPVVVVNVAGASSRIGYERVARSKPDGYTLLLATDTQIYMPGLYTNLLFDPIKDFDAINMFVEVPLVVTVANSLKVDTIKDFIAYVKASPKELNYGSGGVGTANHIGGVLFEKVAGVKMNHVAYKGGGPVVIDLAGGHIEAAFLTTIVVAELVGNKSVKALAIASKERSSLLPDVPTAAEAGIPDYLLAPWAALEAPKGTPREIIDRLNKEVNMLLADPAFRKRLTTVGTVLGTTPQEAQDRIARQAEVTTQLIRNAGITAE